MWGRVFLVHGSGLLLPKAQSKPQIVLLDKLKDAPGVVDSYRMLGKNGIYYQVWEVDLCGTFCKISH